MSRSKIEPIDHDDMIAHLRRRDRTLGRLIDAVGPFALPQETRDPFRALTRAIVYQQLTGKAAATILGRVLALYPGRRFPKPEDILATPITKLRAAGLSQAKATALLDLAAKTVAGDLPAARSVVKMEDEAIIEAITTVRGIGRWSVEMLLMFNLGRMDVLPATDYGVRKGFARVYGWDELPTPRELLEFGERWRPYRTIPSWYFWRAIELPEWRPPRK